MLLLSFTNLLLLVPTLLAQAEDDECGSCCPPVPPPVPDGVVACDALDAKVAMMDKALLEADCEDFPDSEQDEVCHAIASKAIPPCMLEEETEMERCMAEASMDIEEELDSGDGTGADIVSNCKCDTYKKILKKLSSVRDVMCPPDRGGDDDQDPTATTLLVQKSLCKQQSPACWLDQGTQREMRCEPPHCPLPARTIYDTVCISDCEFGPTRVGGAYWCDVEGGSWDYCSPIGSTRRGHVCTSACSKRGERYYWCWRAGGWGYCSPR